MNEEKLTKKEKIKYLVKIAWFLLFTLICAASGLYIIIALPFSVMVLVYFLGIGVCGTAFCSWASVTFIKEYRNWIKKEKALKE